MVVDIKIYGIFKDISVNMLMWKSSQINYSKETKIRKREMESRRKSRARQKK